ncbi:Down syndrome cell adhesion molecule [Nymphon striatum]|nr:Down syndrome cell adhesion molecule [Nymphon striatum]
MIQSFVAKALATHQCLLFGTGMQKHLMENQEKAAGIVSELHIERTERKDTATFMCQVNNNFGSDFMTIHLIVLEPPEPPISLRAKVFDSRGVEISWKHPFDGNSPISKYIIQYKNYSQDWDKVQVSYHTLKGTTTKFKVTDLRPASKYNSRLIAENSEGISEPSKIITFSTSDAEPDAPPRNVSVEVIGTRSFEVSWKDIHKLNENKADLLGRFGYMQNKEYIRNVLKNFNATFAPKKIYWNGLLKGYYVGHKEAGTTEEFSYKSTNISSGYNSGKREYYRISGLRRNTTYAVVVQAFNSAGVGPNSDSVYSNIYNIPTFHDIEFRTICIVIVVFSCDLTRDQQSKDVRGDSSRKMVGGPGTPALHEAKAKDLRKRLRLGCHTHLCKKLETRADEWYKNSRYQHLVIDYQMVKRIFYGSRFSWKGNIMVIGTYLRDGKLTSKSDIGAGGRKEIKRRKEETPCGVSCLCLKVIDFGAGRGRCLEREEEDVDETWQTSLKLHRTCEICFLKGLYISLRIKATQKRHIHHCKYNLFNPGHVYMGLQWMSANSIKEKRYLEGIFEEIASKERSAGFYKASETKFGCTESMAHIALQRRNVMRVDNKGCPFIPYDEDEETECENAEYNIHYEVQANRLCSFG